MVDKRKRHDDSDSENEPTKRYSSKRQKYEKFLASLANFYSEEEVIKELERVIDNRIQFILSKFNIPKIIMNYVIVPRGMLKEILADIILKGAYPPIKYIVKVMPFQVLELNKVNETASSKQSLVELMKKKQEQEEKDKQGKKIKGPDFKNFISQLEEVRGNVLKMIVASLSDWKDYSMEDETKIMIYQLIYSTAISFLPKSFARYFADDDAGVYEELESLLSH